MIVEDGTGLSNADSYASVAEADAYADARNWSDWNESEAHKAALLVRASTYIDATYRFRGQILKITQSMAWPRIGVWDQENRHLEGVPSILKAATIELARVAHTNALMTAPETAAVKRKRVKAGSVETETEYAISSGSSNDFDPSPIATRMLSGLVMGAPAGGAFVAFSAA